MDSHSVTGGSVAYLPIWQGRRRQGRIVAFSVIDADRYDDLAHFRWVWTVAGYAIRCGSKVDGKTQHVLLHRHILGLKKGDPEVDHIDRDKLNNRRANLRTGTHAHNTQNVGSKGGSSKYRGVCWHKGANKWCAYAHPNRVTHYLGLYESEDEAAVASTFRAQHMPFSEDARLAGVQ